MYFDGSLNLEGVGAGALFISPQGDHLKYVLQIHYKASNNSASHFPSESSDSSPTATPRSSSTNSTRPATSRTQ
jgi:hypothetical protein